MISVVNVISDSNLGGAGRLLLSYLKNSDKSRFAHTVLLPKGSVLAERLAQIGVEYAGVDGIAERSMSLPAVSALRARIAGLKPDIVHTHASMSARIAARLYGKCAVVATRHSVFDQSAYKKSFPYKQFAGAMNNGLADVIIAVSPAAKDNIVEIGADPKKIRVIFNGVDRVPELSGEEKAEARAAFGVNAGDFVCAIIARLDPVKGHDYVLEAARLLSPVSRLKFVIAGTGSYEAALKKKAGEMKLTNCVFTGFVREVARLENVMDLQLNASYGTEATSLSLLEGMSLGKPAVISDFGGNPYVIKNNQNGIVVPKKDSEKLARAIKTMLDDKELYTKCSRGALDIYGREFTSKKMAENIDALYCELAGEVRR